jgi:hypothetical protein
MPERREREGQDGGGKSAKKHRRSRLWNRS